MSLAIYILSISINLGVWVPQGWIRVALLAVGYAIVMSSFFVIWADLAPAPSRGQFYAMGIRLMAGAILLGQFISGTVFWIVSADSIFRYTLFSSVALFIGIPMLIVAEEALRKDVIEQRRREEYLADVRDQFT